MAFSLVKSAQGSSALATVTPAFGSATTAGNLIVLAFSSDDYNGTPDAGWTQSTGMEQQGFHGAYVWWRISAGETNYSYTIGSATNSAWCLAEFSGNDAVPYDISGGAIVNTSGTTQTTSTITPSTGNRLLVAMVGGSASGSQGATPWTSLWLNSFTRITDSASAGAGTNDLSGIAYRLVTGNGSTTFSSGATYPKASQQSRSGLIISFKEAAAAGDVFFGQVWL
jgi:hypothetical protein